MNDPVTIAIIVGSAPIAVVVVTFILTRKKKKLTWCEKIVKWIKK